MQLWMKQKQGQDDPDRCVVVFFFPRLCSKNDQTFEPLEPLKNQKVVFGRRNDLWIDFVLRDSTTPPISVLPKLLRKNHRKAKKDKLLDFENLATAPKELKTSLCDAF